MMSRLLWLMMMLFKKVKLLVLRLLALTLLALTLLAMTLLAMTLLAYSDSIHNDAFQVCSEGFKKSQKKETNQMQRLNWNPNTDTDTMPHNNNNRQEHAALMQSLRERFPGYRAPTAGSLRTKVVMHSGAVKGTLQIDTYVLSNAQKAIGAKFWPATGIYFTKSQQLAVMSAAHKRLGQDSPLRHLPTELLLRIVGMPKVMINTQDAAEFQALLSRFTESEEVRIDEFFDAARHEMLHEFYDPERSLWFAAPTMDLEAARRFVEGQLHLVQRVEPEIDPHTGEITYTFYADEDEDRFELSIVFSPTEGLVLVSGLGVDHEHKEDGTFALEADTFHYFVMQLKEKIVEDFW
jgi:hypothetical protein